MYNVVKLRAVHRAPPQQPTRRTCSELETGTEELCAIKWDYHIVSMTAYWLLGKKPTSDEAAMINHIGVTNVAMLTGESRFHISTSQWTESRFLITTSKWVDHWTIGNVCECSEIAGSPQVHFTKNYSITVITLHYILALSHNVSGLWRKVVVSKIIALDFKEPVDTCLHP